EFEKIFEGIIKEEEHRFLGWRTVPIVESACGVIARRALPAIRQIFIGRGPGLADAEAFERKLYVIRKRVTNEIARHQIKSDDYFYICSLSARTIVYKGQLISTQIPRFFPDLVDSEVRTALALVHQRFSTNTFP